MSDVIVTYSKRLAKHSSVYGVGTLLNRAVALVLLPLYTNYLPLDGYGKLELFLITSSFLVLVMQFGMGSAIFRSILYRKDPDSDAVIGTGLIFLTGIGLVLCTLLCLFAEYLAVLIFEDAEMTALLRVLFITDFFLVLMSIPQAKLRIEERSAIFAGIALGNFIVGISLSIFFLAILDLGLAGVIWAQLINAVIFCCIYIVVILKDLKLKFSFVELKEMLSYGLPLVPASVGTSVLLLSNRYFLQHLGQANDVAIFSAAYRVSQVVALLVNAFQMAWPTLLFKIVKEKAAQRTYSKLFTYYFLLLVSICLALSLYAREILLLATSESFLDAERIIPLVVLANLFWGVFYMTNVGIQLKKKTVYVPIIIAITAVTNLGLNYWLIQIPDFSLMGAGIASMISNMLMAVLAWRISLHYYSIQYEYWKLVKIGGLALAVFACSYFIDVENILISVLIKTLLLVIFFVLIHLVNLFSINEKKKLRELIQAAFQGMFLKNRAGK